jgi:hypothetical protein
MTFRTGRVSLAGRRTITIAIKLREVAYRGNIFAKNEEPTKEESMLPSTVGR